MSAASRDSARETAPARPSGAARPFGRPFSRVAVVGAGTMGHGIAQAAAMAGYPTALHDAGEAELRRGMVRIAATLDKGVALGKVAEAAREAALSRLRAARRLEEAVQEADLVIEAVPESMELKTAVLRSVAEAVGSVAPATPSKAVLATNTSSLSVGAMADGLPSPDRFLGLHFFNPVHLMALVEVVEGPKTGVETLERCLEFVRDLGKEPIVVADSPGFASSRLGVALGLEAIRMVEAGVASPPDIDKAMELGYRHPMGPLKVTDLVGLDVRLGIARHLHETLSSEAFRPPALLERMVAEGKLGKKSGRGFYDWSGKSAAGDRKSPTRSGTATASRGLS